MDTTLDRKIAQEFECKRCQRCCEQPGSVYLKEGESERIASFLEQDVYAFVNESCDLEDRTKLVLKKREDDGCIFLTETGCSIHEVKAKQCRDFPFLWRTQNSLKYCEGLIEIS